MQLTNKKIEVTHQMMQANNLINMGKYGIPVNPKDTSRGVRWVALSEMDDADFDALEEYFISMRDGARPMVVKSRYTTLVVTSEITNCVTGEKVKRAPEYFVYDAQKSCKVNIPGFNPSSYQEILDKALEMNTDG